MAVKRRKVTRYIGKDTSGNKLYVDKDGNVYLEHQYEVYDDKADVFESEDDDSDMSYGAGSYGGDYTTAWGGGDTGASSYPNAPDNYRYNNNPSEDILSKWQVTSSKRTVTNPRDLQSTRPLPDDSWDDIPEMAGRGKYSKKSVREAAERMPCVEAAKAEGREVRLQYNHSVNGHKKQTDQLLCPGSRREGRPVIVSFTGDLHSDGSQAAGRKAQLKASCEEEYRATTTSTRTGTDSAADCRPCCDDCDEDKEEKQAAKERLKEKYREQQTTRNRVVDKRSVTDKSQVTRGTQRPTVSPYYDPTSKNQLDRNPYTRYRHSPEYWVPQSGKVDTSREIALKKARNILKSEQHSLRNNKNERWEDNVAGVKVDYLDYDGNYQSMIVNYNRNTKAWEEIGDDKPYNYVLTLHDLNTGYSTGRFVDTSFDTIPNEVVREKVEIKIEQTITPKISMDNEWQITPNMPLKPISKTIKPRKIVSGTSSVKSNPIPSFPPITFNQMVSQVILSDPNTRKTLHDLAEVLKSNPKLIVEITGNSAEKGDEANQGWLTDKDGRYYLATIQYLMEDRAIAVKEMLINNFGVKGNQIRTKTGQIRTRRTANFEIK